MQVAVEVGGGWLRLVEVGGGGVGGVEVAECLHDVAVEIAGGCRGVCWRLLGVVGGVFGEYTVHHVVLILKPLIQGAYLRPLQCASRTSRS